jgi:hypothetical protein
MDWELKAGLLFLGLIVGWLLAEIIFRRKRKARQRREANLQHWIDRKGLARYPGRD